MNRTMPTAYYADRAAVRARHPAAEVYARGGRYVIVRYWPRAEGDRLSLAGCWCGSVSAAWASAARRVREGLPGPGGPGVRA